jgi:hypothetical protein
VNYLQLRPRGPPNLAPRGETENWLLIPPSTNAWVSGVSREPARGQAVQHHGRAEQDLELRVHAEAAAQAAPHLGTGDTWTQSYKFDLQRN